MRIYFPFVSRDDLTKWVLNLRRATAVSLPALDDLCQDFMSLNAMAWALESSVFAPNEYNGFFTGILGLASWAPQLRREEAL